MVRYDMSAHRAAAKQKHAPEILRLVQKTLDALQELVEAQRVARDDAQTHQFLFRNERFTLADVEDTLRAIEAQASSSSSLTDVPDDARALPPPP